MTFSISKIIPLFETSRDAIIGLNDGIVLFMNPRALELFGQHSGEQASKFLPAELLDFSGESLVLSHEIEGKRYSVCSAQSDDLRLLSFSTPLAGGDSAASTLAAHISGQLSSPISTMRSAAMRIMELSKKESVEMSPYINILNRGIYQIQRLSRNLALLENINSGTMFLHLKTEDLIEVVGDITDSVNHFFPDTVRFDADLSGGKDIRADIDKDKFSIMLLNLIANSLHHMGEKGLINVTLKTMRRHPTLTVTDNCGGMSPLAVSQIYSKYKDPISLTNAADGAGIGLAISKGIAEAHGGRIAIDSRKGKGTLVRIMLPPPSRNMLRSRSAFVRPDGMDLMLTELSSVLGQEFYTLEYML